jgi:hypothetical protein
MDTTTGKACRIVSSARKTAVDAQMNEFTELGFLALRMS